MAQTLEQMLGVGNGAQADQKKVTIEVDEKSAPLLAGMLAREAAEQKKKDLQSKATSIITETAKSNAVVAKLIELGMDKEILSENPEVVLLAGENDTDFLKSVLSKAEKKMAMKELEKKVEEANKKVAETVKTDAPIIENSSIQQKGDSKLFFLGSKESMAELEKLGVKPELRTMAAILSSAN